MTSRKLNRSLSLLALSGILLAMPALATEPEMVMYQHPECGCCGKWADHMRENGFRVQQVKTLEMVLVKSEAGMPTELGSCHTATIEGYIVEGHVPASDVQRMLEERPALVGISAPGMPLGSPGMEGPYPAERYDVIGFDGKGGAYVFSSH